MRHGTLGAGAAGSRHHATENVRHATKQGHADKIQRTAMPQTTTRECATWNHAYNRRHATCTGENAADGKRYATGKMQLTTRSVQQTTSRQHAACSGQYAANNKCHAPRNRQHAQDFKQHAADNNDMQHAACNGQRAACNRQRGIRKRPLTTGNKATGQQGNMRHAAATALKTA